MVRADEVGTSTTPSIPLNVLKVAGSILGPATVLTALMFYFGLLHAYWFFGTLGVDYTIFDLTTQDYLTRSADGLFVPLAVVAGASLIGLWGSRLLPTRLDVAWRVAAAPVAFVVLAALGVALLSVSVVGILAPATLSPHVALPGVALSVGVILLMSASRTQRWLRERRTGSVPPHLGSPPILASEWAAVFLLVSIGLFWAAGDYSAAVGTRRGNQVLASLGSWPEVIVYSNTRLILSPAGVRETRCKSAKPEDPPTYRYDRLHLIVHAGGKYLLLPVVHGDGNRQAIVIPDSDKLHLAFTAPGASRPGTC